MGQKAEDREEKKILSPDQSLMGLAQFKEYCTM